MEYFTLALQKYADFTGRSTRTEYWMYVLFYLLFYAVAAIIDNLIDARIFTSILSLALLLPSLSVAARRLHDTGRTGWWQLISLIPVIGIIVLIIFLVQDSHDDNEYGPNPKATRA
jgi:uncharacterized membrane protein YhaH (DUF805 family)